MRARADDVTERPPDLGHPRAPAGPPDTRLPPGFTVRLSGDTVVLGGGATLLGGSGGALLRLKPLARALVVDGRVVVRDRASGTLARLLLDRGLADPVWDGEAARADGEAARDDGEAARDDAEAARDDAEAARVDVEAARDVTVVVPVRDRPEQLARLLATLPTGVPVVVVDDGSRDPAAVAAVARSAGARLVTHDVNRGPAAARNTGTAAATTPVVALVDSDVVPVAGWLATLRRHLEDPAVVAVGPRVQALGSGDGWVARYESARSSLDLGPSPAAVRPHGRVAYLPSATLLVRREPWLADLGGFEESLRVAEDVDAVWRACGSGWRVRYEPAAVVRHDHRTATAAWLRRRAFYGSGAALLAARHGSAVAPAVLTPWTAALTVAALAQRRWSVPALAAVGAVGVASTARRLPDVEQPVRTAAAVHVLGAVATAHQTAGVLTRHHWPVALGAALVSRRARRAWIVAALGQGLLEHRRLRPDLDPVRFLVAVRLDDLAYGAGLWAGALRARSATALLPRWRGPGWRRTSPRSTGEQARPGPNVHPGT